MKRSSINNGFPAGNPIANVFVVLVGALAIAAFIVVGFFAFAIVSSLVLILALVISVRLWWFKRRMKRQSTAGPDASAPGKSDVIEGEFQVVAGDREDE